VRRGNAQYSCGQAVPQGAAGPSGAHRHEIPAYRSVARADPVSADTVVLRAERWLDVDAGDPTQAITTIHDVRFVMKGGRVYKRAD
jgi:hypothetical protein